jgi:hypothetical protein
MYLKLAMSISVVALTQPGPGPPELTEVSVKLTDIVLSAPFTVTTPLDGDAVYVYISPFDCLSDACGTAYEYWPFPAENDIDVPVVETYESVLLRNASHVDPDGRPDSEKVTL